MRFVIITPVRNEEQYIPITMECMLKQTILPTKWIIVNDGSTDSTGGIVEEFVRDNSFIDYISLPDRGWREPATGVIASFYEGLKRLRNIEYDVLAKLDGDLEFPPDTLEKISNAFSNDPELGITGGTRYERRNDQGPLKKVLLPKGFVGGPSKFYRKECFHDIGGLIARAGWDGVDTIKANMKGWTTGQIKSLKIIHLKATGTAIGEGLAKACEKYGDVSYYMGGYFWYFILRVIGRSLKSRDPRVGYYMLKGYSSSRRTNLPRESEEFRRFLRRQQIKNVSYWFKQAFGITEKNEKNIN